MHIDSPAFGPIDVDTDKIIEFPHGLPGFENCQHFTFVEDGDSGAVLQMQSVDDPAVVFSVTDPKTLGVNYEFALSDEEVSTLALTSAADAAVAVIVRKDNGNGSPADAGLKANFMAPLVINTVSRRGMQKVMERVGCDITLRA